MALPVTTRALAATPGVTPVLSAVRDALAASEELRAWLGAATWVDDAIPLARRGARQWLRDFYRDNLLVQGALTLRGRPVLLSRIDASVLAIAGPRDWITPLAQARPLPQLVGSEDVSSLVVDAGHVGLIVGPTPGPAPGSHWHDGSGRAQAASRPGRKRHLDGRCPRAAA